MSTNTAATSLGPPANIQWGRVIGGAFLLELVLFVVLIPLGIAMTPEGGQMTDSTAFLAVVMVGVFVGGAVVTAWILRKTTTGRLLHGTLIGVFAALIYFGLAAAQPGGVAAVIASYGPFLFWLGQVLRLGGCMAGALYRSPHNR